jgi:hypothetical protein
MAAAALAADDPLARVAGLPGVAGAVETARRAVDTLLRHRSVRRRSAELTAEASLRSARACAALAGFDVPLTALRGGLDVPGDGSAPSTVAAEGGEVAPLAVTLATVRLYSELGTLRSTWERAPRQVLARMHVLVGRGLVAEDRLGRPRATDGFPLATDPAGHLAADVLGLGSPPSPEETAVRLTGLTDLLLEKTAAPAIVVAAVTHGELLAIRPFGALDAPIARAASRLVMIALGLDPKALTAPDVGHLEAGDYAEAARAYVNGGAEGVSRWVIHCARAVELGARESLAVCEALSRAEG